MVSYTAYKRRMSNIAKQVEVLQRKKFCREKIWRLILTAKFYKFFVGLISRFTEKFFRGVIFNWWKTFFFFRRLTLLSQNSLRAIIKTLTRILK